MTRDQELQISPGEEARNVVDEEAGTATINETVTIEQLQTVSQLLEYTA